MDLDFSGLDKISKKPNDIDTTKGFTVEYPKNKPKANTKLQQQSDFKRANLEDSAKILKDYQENKRASNQLTTAILKGTQEGNDIYDMFLKAVDVISKLTNDTELLKQVESNIKTIYGIGLGETQALDIEIKAVKKRIARLEQAYNTSDILTDKQRLKRALESHREHLRILKRV